MVNVSRSIYFLDGLLNMKGQLVRKHLKKKAQQQAIAEEVEIEVFSSVNKTFIDHLKQEIDRDEQRLNNHHLNFFEQKKLEMNKRLFDDLHHQHVAKIMKNVRSFLTECNLRGVPQNITKYETLISYKDALEDFEAFYQLCGGK